MLGERTVTVTSYAPGRWVDGCYIAGLPSSRLVAGSVQPLTGADLERLPEGLRTRASLKLYTAENLSMLDEVEVDGVTYLVHAFDAFIGMSLAHGKYTLVARGDDEPTVVHFVAQVVDLNLGGSPALGDVFTATINLVPFAVTADADDTAADLAGKLRALFAGHAAVAVTGSTTHCVLTAKVAGTAFTYAVSKTSAAGTITATLVQENVG